MIILIKRTKEIEDAIKYLNLCKSNSIYREAWSIVYNYINKLEKSEQDLLNELERMSDDGK